MYQNIKNLREDADLTQHQIAQLLNISQTTYSQMKAENWTSQVYL